MKKLKLFLSICTLCLCFAVLCIGIYAAQTVTYTISGTISYTVSDVFATISAKVFKVSGQQSADTMQTNVDTLATTAFSNIDTNTYIEDTTNTIEEYDTTSSNTASRTVAITIDNTYMTYYIVINIANLADRAISAKLTDSTTYTNLNNANKLIQNGIAKGETKNLVVAFSIADEKIGIDSLTINYGVEIGYTEYAEPLADKIVNDSGNKYWYVELGQVSSSDTTKLRWKYVGAYSTNSEGTETFTRYDYSETRPTVGSGSVFVQETALATSTVIWDSDWRNVNYFTSSSLRLSIKDGNLFNLTGAERQYIKDNYIKARSLPDIDWSYYQYGSVFSYPFTDDTHSRLTCDDKGRDYFWLMSIDELYAFFKDSEKEINETPLTKHEEFLWKNSNSLNGYWLRSPCYYYGHYNIYDALTTVDAFSSLNYMSASETTLGVRSAFQLA